MDAAGALNHVFMSTGGTSEWADVLNGGSYPSLTSS